MTLWLVETLYAVTLLMLLVLAVRRPVAHFFGAGWAYALWLLPALRLVLPPLHIFGTSVPSLLPRGSASAPLEGSAVLPAEATSAMAWEPVLLGIWAAGVLLFILWQAVSYFAFLKRLGIGSQIHASLAQDIGVIESTEVEGPIAIGLLDRWIVVPTDFKARYTPTEQRLALQHERIHHQREDIFCNMVALAMLALNWFNPVAYIAFRAFRTDQELSCDAAVAAQASSVERHDYARALVKSASKPGIFAACPLNHAGQLKRRLKMMKGHRKSGLRAAGGSSAVAMLIFGGISVTETAVVAQPVAPVAEVNAAPAVKPAPVAPAAPSGVAAGEAPAPRAKPAPAAKAKAPVAPRAPVKTAAVAPVAPVAATPPAAPAPAAPIVLEVAAPAAPEAVAKAVGTAKAHAHYTYTEHKAPKPVRVRVVSTELRTIQGISPELHAKIARLAAVEMGHVRVKRCLRSKPVEKKEGSQCSRR